VEPTVTPERVQTARSSVAGDVAELTRRFTEALNARDLETLRALVTDDIEFRKAQGGKTLRGDDGVKSLIAAAADADLRLIREGEERVEENGRVAVPVRVMVGRDDLGGTALFEVRDGKIAAFEVITELVRS
jgi:ketosteroid isomerase-like protein